MSDKKNLPRGFYSIGDDQAWLDYSPEELNEPIKLKCTCGTSITMGKDDHIDFHSPHCDLKVLGKK